MSDQPIFVPTQAAEFSGPGKQAIVLYTPDWAAPLLAVLHTKPASYEAGWRFSAELKAHVLTVFFADGPTVAVALIDGIHNPVLAKVAGGSALVLSPYPIYRDQADQLVEQLFDPELSVALPTVPNPLNVAPNA